MAKNPNSHIYASCKFKWTKPDPLCVDKELYEEITRNYRVLPCFENTVFERKYIKHYSLQRNDLLKCRWKQYQDYYGNRVFAPFQFPEDRDLHFYNGSVRFMPAASVSRFPEYRKKLKPGPGVDFQGQMPIPQELLMKRGDDEWAEEEGRKRPVWSAA